MKKLIIILAAFCLMTNTFAFAAEQKNIKSSFDSNYAKAKQNYTTLTSSEMTELNTLLEKAACMLSDTEESELRSLTTKASANPGATTESEINRMADLQLKALNMLPKTEYQRVMTLSAKLGMQ